MSGGEKSLGGFENFQNSIRFADEAHPEFRRPLPRYGAES